MKITVSFLPTKEDYADFVESVAQKNITRRKKQISFLLGIVLMLVGGIFGFLSLISYGEMGLIIMLGLLSALFFPFFYPLFMKYKAVRYYESHGEKMNSVSYIFEEESFSVLSDRYECKNAPYSTIFDYAETEKIFLLQISEGEYRYIPKRVFNPGEPDFIKNKLRK